ncbi:MAG: SWIM zinc finger domain-containing protein [Candidatus Gastranaerophilales bacterium]|nr:SWIM zinc finger domain-containing protein [Candidatus Gastranaerophilales bacterium]
MQQVTEQQIQAMAPNAAAAANGRKISQKGGFVRLECSADDTFYLGECTGSGKSNYITTVDFIDPDNPVCRCSCPSRQFPCKHGLALLYEILAKKNFGVCEIPEDILKKREKKQAKEAKSATAQSADELTVSDPEAAKKKASAAKSAKTAKAKKLKKQLEGLDLAARLIRELTRAGLGAMGGTTLKNYEQLAKQLGDYYLPGPQRLLNGLILEIAAFQKDGSEGHYDAAIALLEKFRTLVKKSQQYLSDKLKQEDVEQDDSLLYEELGGIWKLSELEALGRGKADMDLIQLSFWVDYDAARKEYIDTGCWADLASGEIFVTHNYRPVKALKYVKQEDTVFGVAHVPMAVCYPGEGNLRVRWDGAKLRPVESEDLQKLRTLSGTSLTAEAKTAKNLLKNALADPLHIRLISYALLGQAEEGFALKTEEGETIALGDAPGMEPSTDRLALLPDQDLLQHQTLLGAFYYDSEARRLKIQPLSIITQETIVRLLY